MLLGDVGHETELFLGEDGAGRVAGVREEDGAGVLVDARLDALTDGELVVLLRRRGDRADGRAGQRDERAVVRVERLGDDDLVALVEDAAERDLQRLAAAGGDEHLLVGDGRVDLAVVVDDGVDHFRHAVGRGVGQDRLAEVLDGLEVGLGGGNIGLADVQVVELLAFFGSLIGIGRKLAHGREAAFFDLAGKFHVAPPFIFVFLLPFLTFKRIHDNAFFQKLQLIFWKNPATNLTITLRRSGRAYERPPQHCAAAAGAYLVSMRAQTLKSTEVAP